MGSKLYQFTPSELQKLLDESNGYSDVLRKVGMNPKGDNPQTLKKIIEEYNLDITKMNNNRKELFRKAAHETHKKQQFQYLKLLLIINILIIQVLNY